MEGIIDGTKINEKLGPPSYLEALLEDICTKKSKIVEGLTSFLTLPYVNALKVKDRTGKDVSLHLQVLSLKTKYQNLQDRTIPTVMQISAYGRVSQALLPVVGKGELTLNHFLQVNTGLILRYGQQAKVIAKETNDLKAEFTDLLDLLESNLREVVKKIAEQESALHEAEKQYAYEKAAAIISGIITVCFVIGAGVSLCTGAVPLALELGALALYETIAHAMDASNLAGVIANLKSGIESAKKTKEQLESLLPLLTEIANMFSEIGKAWDTMSNSLSEIKVDYLAWSKPELFKPVMLTMVLNSWNKAHTHVDIYVRTMLGIQLVSASDMNIDIAAPMAFSAQSNAEPQWQEAKAMSLVADLTIQDTSRNLCREIFSAPPVRGMFPQSSEIQNIANNYAQVAIALQQVGSSDIARQCDAIRQALSANVVPSQDNALAALRKFAEKQPDIPSLPLEQTEWDSFCVVRMAAVKDGRAKTDICYKSIHDVQNSTSTVRDNLTARIAELGITLQRLERQIREAEEEKARALQNPFGLIDQLIRELVARLTGMYQERGRYFETINYTQSCIQRAEICLQMVTTLGDSTANIDSMWDSMQTKMINASDVWPVLHEVKLADLEIDLYKSTWNAVRAALGN